MGKQRKKCDISTDIGDVEIDESMIREDDCEEIDLYDYYISEVSDIPCNTNIDNEKLIREIHGIIEELNVLFASFKCDDSILSGPAIPWIEDKVEYCLKNCNNIDKLGKLKNLYSQFVEKRNQLVEGNLRLVISIAKTYHRDNQISFNDVIQFGNIGLMRAVEKYNPGLNAAFSTYSHFWIRQNIIRNLRKTASAVEVPSYLIDDYRSLQKCINMLCQEVGRNPTNDELAKCMGFTLDKVEVLLMTFVQSVSLNEPVEMLYDNLCASLIDFVPADDVNVCEEVANNEMKEKLIMYMSEYLTDREVLVLKWRFGINCQERTFVEIAEELGVTYQRIEQIQSGAIKKLRRIPQIGDMISYFR